ncbi:MAG TPA: hypothetical protein VL501_06605 [Pyrinomonadaceae bacterium]|nr:hypothetical protein [Pyrinomonadaceae bacterium]
MHDISLFRLYLLRAGYLIIFVGLALMIWPLILVHDDTVPHMNTAVRSLLGAVCLLAGVGLRYPLKMLPIFLFELVWKTIWIISFGLPLWFKGKLTGDFAETMFNCLFTVILIPLIPWGYVYRNYIKAAGERWRNA